MSVNTARQLNLASSLTSNQFRKRDEWTTWSNEALSLKFVSSVDELDNNKGEYKPEYTHQFFGDEEEIRGYKGLKINFFYTSSCLFYFNVEWKEKSQNSEQIFPYFADFFPTENKEQSIVFSKEDFNKEVNNNKTFVPPGQKIFEYSLSSENKEGESEIFEIFFGTLSDEKVLNYHQKIQFFLLFYIDGARYLDEDQKWHIYFLFRTIKKEGVFIREIAGLVTVYPFYAHPSKTRPRLSQFLILPNFQRKGHGERVLNEIYQNEIIYNKNDKPVKDFTVEDPASSFQTLRDVTDLKNLHKNKLLDLLLQAKEWNANTLYLPINQSLLLYKKQVRRLFEIVKFSKVDNNDVNSVNSFKDMLYYRLERTFKESLPEEEEEKKESLDELYKITTDEYSKVISKLKSIL
eukprot:TRINITY_DN680_c0_g1_i1.p1 TRINITY_DN680_c0_g1~~TRINITY_DN680_c0_g1_i1.p1  ORF type:complete len:453 (-),score=175.73 TRINITY_DN680_c0_g1_i1:115-1329(-)